MGIILPYRYRTPPTVTIAELHAAETAEAFGGPPRDRPWQAEIIIFPGIRIERWSSVQGGRSRRSRGDGAPDCR